MSPYRTPGHTVRDLLLIPLLFLLLATPAASSIIWRDESTTSNTIPAMPADVMGANPGVAFSAAEWDSMNEQMREADYFFAPEIAADPQMTSYTAPNRAQDMLLTFDQEGLHAAPSRTTPHAATRGTPADWPAPMPRAFITPDWEWQMTLLSYGYGTNQQPAPEADLLVDGNRLEYQRGEMLEWYVNDEQGVKQNFLLREPPEGAAVGVPLVLNLALSSSFEPQLSDDGQAISFFHRENMLNLTYDSLYVYDVYGRELPAHFTLDDDDTVQIVVDDERAAYPITIDPLLTLQTKLVSAEPDSELGDDFGYSLAVDRDILVVGAPGHNSEQGAAYVFQRVDGGEGWVVRAKLVADDGAAGDGFGTAVAISGDASNPGETVLVGAPTHNSGQGAAYIFTGINWVQPGALPLTQDAKLSQSAGSGGDRFGSAVALDANDTGVALVGAPGVGAGDGAAYIFTGGGATWAEQTQLTSGVSSDSFGTAVALNGAGDLALVGAPLANATAGAAYLFEEGGDWSSVTDPDYTLTDSGATAGDALGASVSLNNAGDLALVGAPGTTGEGAAYLFAQPGGGWATATAADAELTASDGAIGNGFGVDVVLNSVGDAALVGAVTVAMADSGAAYVFKQPAGGWADASEDARLTTSSGTDEDRFGLAVALNDDTVLVGASSWQASEDARGAVYSFNEPVASWQDTSREHARLTAGLNDLPDTDVDQMGMGSAVAIDGDTIVVGAPLNDDKRETPVRRDTGAVYVFVREGNGWRIQARLKPEDYPTARDYFFGTSVDLDGDTLLIGAPGAQITGSTTGAAYVFTRTDDTWTQEAVLSADLDNDRFGTAVVLGDNIALVGAPNNSGNDGAAFIFVEPTGGWADTQTADATLTPDATGTAEQFGAALALDGNTALIGAPAYDNNGTDDGAAYIFTGSDASWSRQAFLTDSRTVDNDNLGTSVALADDTALLGAPGDPASSAGAAYIFEKPGSGGWADATAADALLTADTGANGDTLGTSVTLNQDVAVVGARGGGSVYLYVKPATGGWADATEDANQTVTDGDAISFGAAVALDGRTLAVGAPLSDDGRVENGATFVLRLARPSVSLTSSENPALVGEEITLTVTVGDPGPAPGTPGGDVEFFDGDTSLGTATLDSDGQATLNISTLDVGSHDITVVYQGDSDFFSGTSSVLVQVINEPTPTPTSTPVPPTATSTPVPPTATSTPTPTYTPTPTVETSPTATTAAVVELPPTATSTPAPVVEPEPPAASGTPDLQLQVTCSEYVSPGRVLICILTYENTGDGPAANVRLTAEVPAGASFDAAESSPGWQPLASAAATRQQPASTYVYEVGTLEPAANGGSVFALRINDDVPLGTTITVPGSLLHDVDGTSTVQQSDSASSLVAVFTVNLPLVTNAFELTPAAPPLDLVASVSLSPNQTTFAAGEAVEVTVVVTNLGSEPTPRDFWVDLYINPEPVPAPDTLPLRWDQTCSLTPCLGIAWEVTEPLGPGESITLTSTPDSFDVERSRWGGWFAAGTTDLYVYVDAWGGDAEQGLIEEADETNNRAELRGLEVTGDNPSTRTLRRGPLPAR